MTTADALTTPPLSTGIWKVDADNSELTFASRGMFGIVPVHGHFGAFAGTLTIDAVGAQGELTIESASLDTHHAKRDAHLKSADFFDVQAYPTVTFELTSLSPGSDGDLAMTGVLRIRDTALAIAAPVKVSSTDPDHATLTTALAVDRTAAGVGWSKLGMIQGKAHLTAKLSLTKQA